jgi:hypothetical protein
MRSVPRSQQCSGVTVWAKAAVSQTNTYCTWLQRCAEIRMLIPLGWLTLHSFWDGPFTPWRCMIVCSECLTFYGMWLPDWLLLYDWQLSGACHSGGASDYLCRVRFERDGTRAETRFGLSAKRLSPFKSARESVQLTTGSRGVRISRQRLYYL